MRWLQIFAGLGGWLFLCALNAGCSPIPGERFWWDDQKQNKLSADFSLPEWPPETPLADGEKLYVDKKLPANEPERAKTEELRQIAAGIPRTGVPDPLADPVHVPVGVWGNYDADNVGDTDSYQNSPNADTAENSPAVAESPANPPADN